MGTSTTRDLDLIVYGATGFVGTLVAEYLAEHAPAGMAIGLAGRSRMKLEQVRAKIPGATDWPIIVADADDPKALGAMVQQTRVVLTTVGPYARHGMPLVGESARAGTHYADLTGELLFIRDSIDAFHEVAQGTGARIIHSAGFDSVPSDMGVLALHRIVQKNSDGVLGATVNGVMSLRGGISGGTAASMMDHLAQVRDDPERARIVADPYAFSPDRAVEPDPGDGPDFSGLEFDNDLDSWLSPFVMAPVNSRTVRRTNALTGYMYSQHFRYTEALALGAGVPGLAASAGAAGLMSLANLGLNNSLTRPFASRVLPRPGEGPSEKTRKSGRFMMRIVTNTPDGFRYRATVSAEGDPGYQATSMMMSQVGLSLALDQDRLPDIAGVLTPASGVGNPGLERLRRGGLAVDAHPDPPVSCTVRRKD